MIVRFFVYGFLGLVTEVLWTGIGSAIQGNINLTGQTSVWMFFVYGSAVFIFEPIHDRIRDTSWVARGMLWMALFFSVEFLSGLIFRFAGIEVWRYDCEYSVIGLIRLDYAPAWFAAGLIFEKIHDVLISVHF